jgi:acyl carrier protein
MITIEEVVRLIRRELRGKVSADLTIGENTKLQDLGLSSLQIAEIVFTLEDDHGVEFDPGRAAGSRVRRWLGLSTICVRSCAGLRRRLGLSPMSSRRVTN